MIFNHGDLENIFLKKQTKLQTNKQKTNKNLKGLKVTFNLVKESQRSRGIREESSQISFENSYFCFKNVKTL